MDPTEVYLALPRGEHGQATSKIRSISLQPVEHGHGAELRKERTESQFRFLAIIILFDDNSVSSFPGYTFDANSYALHGRTVPSVTSPIQSSLELSTSLKTATDSDSDSVSVIATGTISDPEDESARRIIGSRRGRPQDSKRARNTIPIEEAQVDISEEYWTRDDELIYDKITEPLNDEEDFTTAMEDLRARLGASPEDVHMANQTL